MKLLVVLALVGLVAAGKKIERERHVNFCRGNSEAKEDAESVRLIIRTALPSIIGHCPTAQAALTANTFFNKECEVAFDQGFCYISNKINEYNLEEVLSTCTAGEGEDYEVTTTYKDMARVLLAGGDVLKLGRIACAHALPCLEHVVAQIGECAANDDDFYRTALNKALPILRKYIPEDDAIADFVECHFGAESDAMTLLGLVQDRINSFDDIVALFNEYFSEGDQARIATRAKETLYNFIEGANAFCGAGCVRKTAKFFKDLFIATHDEETCPVVGLYCGGCQANADQHIAENAGSIPCCTQTALNNIHDAIHDMINEYSGVASDIEDDIKEAVEAAGISTERYEALKALGLEQAACLDDTYEKLAESDCS